MVRLEEVRAEMEADTKGCRWGGRVKQGNEVILCGLAEF